MINWKVNTETARLLIGVLHLNPENDYTESYFLLEYEDDAGVRQECEVPVTILDEVYWQDLRVVLGWLASLNNFSAQRLTLDCKNSGLPIIVIGGSTAGMRGYSRRYYDWESIPEDVTGSLQVLQAAMTTFPGKHDIYAGL